MCVYVFSSLKHFNSHTFDLSQTQIHTHVHIYVCECEIEIEREFSHIKHTHTYTHTNTNTYIDTYFTQKLYNPSYNISNVSTYIENIEQVAIFKKIATKCFFNNFLTIKKNLPKIIDRRSSLRGRSLESDGENILGVCTIKLP
jgi:hypothetical protein